jgi:uncharacterized membrane protein YfcA
MPDLTLEVVVLLVAAAGFAGFVDAIAGGGGLITVPALLLAGLPPVDALATNKLQGSFGAGSAMLRYAWAGQVRLGAQGRPAAVSFLAAGLGSAVALVAPAEALRAVLPAVLVGVALFLLVKRDLGDADRAARMRPAVFGLTVVPAVAFYDGILGPGTGSFFMLGFVLLAGFGLLRATAETKALNCASNLGSLAVFALAGGVWWGLGLAMAAAQVAGAQAGARLAVRCGARVIRPLLVVVSLALAARLAWADG